jgi:hypothetical protein
MGRQREMERLGCHMMHKSGNIGKREMFIVLLCYNVSSFYVILLWRGLYII